MNLSSIWLLSAPNPRTLTTLTIVWMLFLNAGSVFANENNTSRYKNYQQPSSGDMELITAVNDKIIVRKGLHLHSGSVHKKAQHIAGQT